MGSAHSGHYISFVRLGDGRWCKCDDGRVEEVDEATVLKQKAYLLFYERGTVRGPPPLRTEEQQARVVELRRLNAERTTRVKAVQAARREIAEAAKRAAKAEGKRPGASGKGEVRVVEGGGEWDEEMEVEQTLTVPSHTITFVGKQVPRRRAAAAARAARSSASASDTDSDEAEESGSEVEGEDEGEGEDEEGDAAVDLPKIPWPNRVICAVRLPTVRQEPGLRPLIMNPSP